MPVSHRDRTGLVEQHDIDVPGHLHRLAALGQNIGPEGALHARYAYGGQKGANCRWNEAHEQCDQRRYVSPEALERLRDPQIAHHVLLRVPGHRPERNNNDEEYQRHGREGESQCHFVRTPLANCAFDKSDHSIEKRFSRSTGNPDDDPVGKHECPACHSRPVAAGFPDYRCRLAGDR